MEGYLKMYFFFLSYPILGAGLKYIDDAFDATIFNKKLAMVLAPLLAILWAYTMIIDQISATILLAILLGVLLKGKIDNLAHFIGLLIILGIVIGLGVEFLILPLIVLTVAALLDEVGNDFVDKKQYLHSVCWWQRIIGYFFDQRWAAKVAILGIVLLGIFPYYFFLAMLLFDGAYVFVNWVSETRQQKQREDNNRKLPSSEPLVTLQGESSS
jgi:hypothetical protein